MAKEKSDQAAAIWTVIILIAIGLFTLNVKLNENKSYKTPIVKPSLEERINKTAIDMLNKEQYPKTFEEWGADKITWLNSLQRPAAKYALKNHNCDVVNSVSLSPSRSYAPNVAIFNVDCNNGNRYYIADEFLR